MGDKNKVEIVIGARDEASGVLSSLTAKMAGFASLVASYFGVSLFSSAVKGAADLEEGMSRVQAASAATAQEMDALRKAATDAGANGEAENAFAAAVDTAPPPTNGDTLLLAVVAGAPNRNAPGPP